jgi:hypothetical protein
VALSEWLLNMGFPMQFYRFEQPRSDSPEDRAGSIDVMPEDGFNVGPGPTCPACDRPLGWLSWLPPYRLELETWGKQYGDIAKTGNDLIVSERLKQVFADNGLKGLMSFEPVEIINVVHRRGKPKTPLPLYYKATVVRSPTTIDQAASGYVWEDDSRISPECLMDTLKRYRCLIVKAETWNGDDVFFPRGGNGLMMSERFRTVFMENNLRGAAFIPSESPEAGYDSFPWEAGTP